MLNISMESYEYSRWNANTLSMWVLPKVCRVAVEWSAGDYDSLLISLFLNTAPDKTLAFDGLRRHYPYWLFEEVEVTTTATTTTTATI